GALSELLLDGGDRRGDGLELLANLRHENLRWGAPSQAARQLAAASRSAILLGSLAPLSGIRTARVRYSDGASGIRTRRRAGWHHDERHGAATDPSPRRLLAPLPSLLRAASAHDARRRADVGALRPLGAPSQAPPGATAERRRLRARSATADVSPRA